MKLDVYNIKGEKTQRQTELPDDIFAIAPNDHAIYLDVKRIMSSMRQGTHKAKERAEIAGSTKKLRRQKGTGGARVGNIKSPVFKGGGRIFGPKPRDYDIKLNKKVKELARKSALSYKIIDNKLLVIEDFDFEIPKTKEYLSMLQNFKLQDVKTLCVTKIDNFNVFLAGRNLPDSYICPPEKLNTYEILNNDSLIITESALEVIKEILMN